MQAANNKDKNESNVNFLADLFYHTRQLISGLVITTSAILVSRSRLLIQGIFAIESINRIPKAAACIGFCPPTPAPPPPVAPSTAVPPASTAVPPTSTAAPPASTSSPRPKTITKKKSHTGTLPQSNSDRSSISRSRLFSHTNSKRDSISNSKLRSHTHSKSNPISHSNPLSRSHSNQNSFSRLVDWVFSQSKTASYPSISFASGNQSHSPSLTPLSNAMNEMTRTQITLGFPHIPSPDPLARIIPAHITVVLTGLGVGAGGISGLLNPSYANTLTNMFRIVKACQEEDIPGLPYFPPYQPVALGSSEPGAAAANGAIITTTGIMVAILSAVLLTGYFRNQIGTSVPNKWLVRLAAAILGYYGPNICELIVSSMGSFSAGSGELAIIAMIIWQAVFFAAGYLVYRKVSKEEPSTLELSPLYESARDFKNQPVRLVMFVDMFEANMIAMLAGMKSNLKANSESCKTISISMAVVPLVYASYLVKFHPHESHLELSIVVIGVVFQVLLSVLNMVTVYNNHNDRVLDAIGWIELLAICLSFAQAMASFIIELKNKCNGLREKTNAVDNPTTLSLPKLDAMQPPTLEAAANSPRPDNILGIQDDEPPVEHTQATTVIDIGISSDEEGHSLKRQRPARTRCDLIDNTEDSHDIAIEMSPQPMRREQSQSPQHSDSTESQGLSRSPERELGDSDFENQLLEIKQTKPKSSLHDSLFSMYYPSVRKNQAPTIMVDNEPPLKLDFL